MWRKSIFPSFRIPRGKGMPYLPLPLSPIRERAPQLGCVVLDAETRARSHLHAISQSCILWRILLGSIDIWQIILRSLIMYIFLSNKWFRVIFSPAEKTPFYLLFYYLLYTFDRFLSVFLIRNERWQWFRVEFWDLCRNKRESIARELPRENYYGHLGPFQRMHACTFS